MEEFLWVHEIVQRFVYCQSAMIFVVIVVHLKTGDTNILYTSLCSNSTMSYARYTMEGCFWGSRIKLSRDFSAM